MSDDRELVERLAAIDATPRAGWVAELRADLDTAWETGDAGYLVSLRTTTLTLVDREPTPSEPSSGRRWLILMAAAAVIVVAIAFVAARDHNATPADQPSPTVTVPSTPPRALPATGDAQLVPGTYYVDEVDDGALPARILLTIGAGWNGPTQQLSGDHVIPSLAKLGQQGWPDAIGGITFSRPDRVYLDACHVSDGFHPGPVTTLDGLVAALYEQGGWADVTAPTDITIDGHPGKMFQRTAPAVLSDCPNGFSGHMRLPETDGGALISWPYEDDSSVDGPLYEPGQFETLLILDIDGTVVVINANLFARWSCVWLSTGCPDPASPSVEFDAPTLAAARAEFAAVLDSIRINPVTVPPATPRALFATPGERLLPGTYYVDEADDGTPTPERIFVTIGAGWEYTETAQPPGPAAPPDQILGKPGQHGGGEDAIGFITFSRPNRVYLDACHAEDGFHPGPLTTLDGLAVALYEQRGWADVTAPLDITIDGHPGKMFQRTAPTVLAGCNEGSNRLSGQDATGPIPGGPALRSWLNEDESNLGGRGYEPDQFETLLILDIDGTVVVVNAALHARWACGRSVMGCPDAASEIFGVEFDASTLAAARAEFAAVLDSLRINPVTVPPTTPPTTPTRPLLVAKGEEFVPGTYFVDEVDGTPTPARIFVTIGDGWTGFAHPGEPYVQSIDKHGQPGITPEDDIGHIAFSRPNQVYLDACHASDGLHPGPVTTRDGLVAALSEQRGWADVTAPQNMGIDGYPATVFQRTAPAVLSDCPNVPPGRGRDPSLDSGGLSSWLDDGCCYEPGQIEGLLIVDIDGTVIVIHANLYAQTSAAARVEFATVLQSIRIDPR